MGTRADFYVGRGKNAKWLGSIAWDGYPAGLWPNKDTATAKADISKTPVIVAATEEAYRKAVDELLASRSDATWPKDGWPWPWDDSNTTDYAYAFDAGQTWGTCFGHGWWPAAAEPAENDAPKDIEWPNMKECRKIAWGERSGIILIIGPNKP